jgi:hypothetical protein
VGTSEIADGSIATADIGAGQVTTTEIAANAVDDSKVINDITVNSTKIVSSVSTVTNTGGSLIANVTLGDDADADSVAGVAISATSANTGDADSLYGMMITALASPDAGINESAIRINDGGWDNAFEIEGATLDGNQTLLRFTDPTADRIVTFPNLGGTVLLSGNDNIAAGDIATGAVTTTEISNGTIATADVANNAIDGTKIALGSDAQGDVMYYNGTDYVRLAAGSNGDLLTSGGAGANPSWAAPTGGGDITAVGDVASGGAFIDGNVSGSKFTYEGVTNDTNETVLTFGADPVADATITIPNTTGTLITTGDSGTVSSTMITDATIAAADVAANTLTAA